MTTIRDGREESRWSLRRLAAVGCLAAALTTAACGSGSGTTAETEATANASPSKVAAAPTAAPASDGAVSVTLSATTTSPSDGAAEGTEVASCSTSSLSAEVAPAEGGGAAGSVYWDVTLTNTGTEACTLTGYPGVSFEDEAGAQVGEPADRDSSDGGAAIVRLEPGDSAEAPLRVTNPGVIEGCTSVTSSSVVIYPPDQTDALTVSAQVQVCQEKVSTTIGVFAAGA